MTDAVREQISACLDGELPTAQLDLLAKRVTRDPALGDAMRRYALIGETLRNDKPAAASRGFAASVMAALEQEPAMRRPGWLTPTLARRLRPVAGMAVAAGVAAMAVLGVQQFGGVYGHQFARDGDTTVVEPGVVEPGVVEPGVVESGAETRVAATAGRKSDAGTAASALNENRQGSVIAARLSDSYTVPAPGSTSMSVFVPATRLTNYVVAHSEYSSPLGRRSVLTSVLADDEGARSVAPAGMDQDAFAVDGSVQAP